MNWKNDSWFNFNWEVYDTSRSKFLNFHPTPSYVDELEEKWIITAEEARAISNSSRAWKTPETPSNQYYSEWLSSNPPMDSFDFSPNFSQKDPRPEYSKYLADLFNQLDEPRNAIEEARKPFEWIFPKDIITPDELKSEETNETNEINEALDSQNQHSNDNHLSWINQLNLKREWSPRIHARMKTQGIFWDEIKGRWYKERPSKLDSSKIIRIYCLKSDLIEAFHRSRIKPLVADENELEEKSLSFFSSINFRGLIWLIPFIGSSSKSKTKDNVMDRNNSNKIESQGYSKSPKIYRLDNINWEKPGLGYNESDTNYIRFSDLEHSYSENITSEEKQRNILSWAFVMISEWKPYSDILDQLSKDDLTREQLIFVQYCIREYQFSEPDLILDGNINNKYSNLNLEDQFGNPCSSFNQAGKISRNSPIFKQNTRIIIADYLQYSFKKSSLEVDRILNDPDKLEVHYRPRYTA